ncbi:hypothetical protein [Rivibacter subsaxonicus]|uniref:Uncharacterized protein n=1 Tax=Rivibacter subsaxonicus TaxID=457575 RepID=A0A4Q7VZH8_9BURK|nr:hypothetical protein [Rivibacter subsaxonicus]RZU02312.1 hypothetical protein EV670_0335 [Rivibacter subsaxonicus]
MSGLFLLVVLIGWAVVAFLLARWATQLFKSPGVRVLVGVVAFPVLLLLPLVDEIIGMWQFDALCKKYAVQEIDEPHAKNRKVRYVRRGVDRYADGTLVRIRIDPIVYRDAETDQILVSYHTLEAKGGWLIRTLGISETGSPLLFNAGCAPPDQDGFKQNFNITVVN